jgi:hypothetical protein
LVPYSGHQEIAVFFIMNDGFLVGVVIGRIPCRRFEEMKVVVEKEAEFPFSMGQVFQKDLFDVDILSVIHQVVAVKADSERTMGCSHLGHEHFIGVIQAKPPVSVNPAKLTVDPDPQPEFMPSCVILFAHVGIIDIPQTVILIKRDQQRSISDRNITGHLS